MIFDLFRPRAMPVVGAALPRDARDLAAIHHTGFERGWDASEFERLLADESVLGHVARPGGRGRATGFVLSRLVVDESEILTIAVDPRSRGAGQGRLLLRTHLGRLAALGVRSVFLEVAEDNRPALRLYRSFGFEEVGRREGYYGRRAGAAATALVMRRDLA
jgi:[ribosomal protein S18]-alanine N-acetyltransferase